MKLKVKLKECDESIIQETITFLREIEEKTKLEIIDMLNDDAIDLAEQKFTQLLKTRQHRLGMENKQNEIETILQRKEESIESSIPEIKLKEKNKSQSTFSWVIENDKIRTEVHKNDKYVTSNIVPLSLFKKIVSCSLNIYNHQKHIKTKDILNEMEQEIILESNYKKTPRVVVKVVFDILIKENFLIQIKKGSHRFVFTENIQKTLTWLEAL